MPDITWKLLCRHLALYPGMAVEDALKLLYQGAMGPGHLIGDEGAFIRRLAEELALPGLFTASPFVPAPLGGGLCRVHLSTLENGPSPATLARLCAITAGRFTQKPALLRDRTLALRQWVEEARLPWRGLPALRCIDAWIKTGCPQPGHSKRFNALYAPHYRVMAADMALYLPVLAAIDRALSQKSHLLVCIDGMSAAGKSSLAALLEQIYRCGVIHADDFFLQPHQRTLRRLAEAGGNIDYERLAPVARLAADNRAFSFTAYDCQNNSTENERQVPAGAVTVLEGAYSLHKKVGAKADVLVFLWLDAGRQRQRILRRNPAALAERFFTEWIPMENDYFRAMQVRQRCDVVLDTGPLDDEEV